jgi:hypothetical protein
MPLQPDYRCTGCQAKTKRDDLTVKKSVFLEMGAGGKTIRSRVTGWLCPSCVVIDEDWNRERHAAPGNALPEMRPLSG